jgi:hypothetical protein
MMSESNRKAFRVTLIVTTIIAGICFGGVLFAKTPLDAGAPAALLFLCGVVVGMVLCMLKIDEVI